MPLLRPSFHGRGSAADASHDASKSTSALVIAGHSLQRVSEKPGLFCFRHRSLYVVVLVSRLRPSQRGVLAPASISSKISLLPGECVGSELCQYRAVFLRTCGSSPIPALQRAQNDSWSACGRCANISPCMCFTAVVGATRKSQVPGSRVFRRSDQRHARRNGSRTTWSWSFGVMVMTGRPVSLRESRRYAVLYRTWQLPCVLRGHVLNLAVPPLVSSLRLHPCAGPTSCASWRL